MGREPPRGHHGADPTIGRRFACRSSAPLFTTSAHLHRETDQIRQLEQQIVIPLGRRCCAFAPRPVGKASGSTTEDRWSAEVRTALLP